MPGFVHRVSGRLEGVLSGDYRKTVASGRMSVSRGHAAARKHLNCSWTGTVKTLYVNDANRILMYFDPAIDPQLAIDEGLTCGSTHPLGSDHGRLAAPKQRLYSWK